MDIHTYAKLVTWKTFWFFFRENSFYKYDRYYQPVQKKRKEKETHHNLTPYKHFKNRPTWCDVEGCKRFECVFLITNWFWGEMAQFTVQQIVSKKRSWIQVMGISLWERDCWGTTIWLLTTSLKTDSCGVMSKGHKRFEYIFLITD